MRNNETAPGRSLHGSHCWLAVNTGVHKPAEHSLKEFLAKEQEFGVFGKLVRQASLHHSPG